MRENLDKRTRADLFRARLSEAMRLRATNQSALARAIGVDRSTVSQLLKGPGARLPNALGVSADWLLGLTARPETAADMLANSLSLTEAPRALVDEQIFQWHKEAAGYKIRHVPAALPDMLKTRAMLEWEYAPSLGRSTDQAIGASEDRMAWMRAARSDYEIALPVHEIESFARGEGYYHGLPADLRASSIPGCASISSTRAASIRPRSRSSARCWRCSISGAITWFSATAPGSKRSPRISTDWCARPPSRRATCRITSPRSAPRRAEAAPGSPSPAAADAP
jgi:plasmid maintenance system antidote protein VapI